ncbi:response regulator [Pseudomonas sp. MWU13-3659]|uniref:response regulator n=1 Tax=Pseudomonas sp. MWU13-3659 TaxID=2986964 RepID=UPI0020763CF7|nr:response regulator [Pseudomonas sp. MWU13-3659]
MSESRFPLQPQPGTRRLNVLVVDGHPASRLLFKLQLLRLGHDATVVDDGRQALRLYLASPFDVVFSDCNMPNMDGCRLARALRLHEVRRQLCPSLILGVTARQRKMDAQRCFVAGMDGCLAKPLSVTQLQALLNCGSARMLGMVGLEMAELERLAAGEPKVLVSLLQMLIDTNRHDARLLLHCARHRDLQGMRLLAHRIKGAVRMIKAQALIEACQLIEEQSVTVPARINTMAGSLRMLGLEVQRLEIVLRRYQACYHQGGS